MERCPECLLSEGHREGCPFETDDDYFEQEQEEREDGDDERSLHGLRV